MSTKRRSDDLDQLEREPASPRVGGGAGVARSQGLGPTVELEHELTRVEHSRAKTMLRIMKRMEEEDTFSKNPKAFSEILHLVLNRGGLEAKELAEAQQISRSSISKWANGFAAPNVPTRRAVISWIEGKLTEQLRN